MAAGRVGNFSGTDPYDGYFCVPALSGYGKPGTVKCSLRAKSTGNVVDIASFFGGGGHVKAAGYTFRGTMDDARRTLKEQLERSRDTLQGR